MATRRVQKVQKAQKNAGNLDVPDLSEDAAERKRVLNVLAQRRYRKRKRERVDALESHIRNTSTQLPERGQKSPLADASTAQQHSEPRPLETSEKIFIAASPKLCTPNLLDIGSSSNAPFLDLQQDAEYTNFPEFQAGSEESAAYAVDLVSADYSVSPPFSSFPLTCFDTAINATLMSGGQGRPWSWDPSILLPVARTPSRSPSPSLALSSSSTSEHSFSFISTHCSVRDAPHLDLSSSLQERQASTFTFPDDYTFGSLEMKLLRSVMIIAKRLNLGVHVSDPSATSPFSTPSSPISSSTGFSHLPLNFQPTPMQLAVKHHPLMDLLPWATARNKLIIVFSQAPEYRPPTAASENALLDFAYDLEDSAEGVRIWGDDPFNSENWEIGQKIFSRWWWAFDSEIIANSNKLRGKRGASRLVMGEVIGEVL